VYAICKKGYPVKGGSWLLIKEQQFGCSFGFLRAPAGRGEERKKDEKID